MGGVSKFQQGFVKSLIPESGGMHGQIGFCVLATWRKSAAKIQEWEAVKSGGMHGQIGFFVLAKWRKHAAKIQG